MILKSTFDSFCNRIAIKAFKNPKRKPKKIIFPKKSLIFFFEFLVLAEIMNINRMNNVVVIPPLINVKVNKNGIYNIGKEKKFILVK